MRNPDYHPERRLTEQDICAYGFSTPWDAPTIPPFPLRFRQVSLMTLAWRTDMQAIRALLPPPLEPTSDVVLAHISTMRDPEWIGPFGEANIMVGCRYPQTGEEGGYSPYFFLSSDMGVAHGREVHGQPKKLGRPVVEARGDTWVATVERNGIEFLTGTMAYKQKPSDIARLSEYFDFSTNINLKAVDHIDATPAIRQLTARRLSDVVVHECWSGLCTVELRPHIQAPVHRLPVREMLEGFHWTADFSLVPGRILHDYLRPAAQSVSSR